MNEKGDNTDELVVDLEGKQPDLKEVDPERPALVSEEVRANILKTLDQSQEDQIVGEETSPYIPPSPAPELDLSEKVAEAAPAAKDNVLKLVPNAPAKTEDEMEKTAEPVAPKTAGEAVSELAHLPPRISEAINILVARETKDAKKNLRLLWKKYKNNDSYPDDEQAAGLVRTAMQTAERSIEDSNASVGEIAYYLNIALENAGFYKDEALYSIEEPDMERVFAEISTQSDTGAESTPSTGATVTPLTAAVAATRASNEQEANEQTPEKVGDQKDKDEKENDGKSDEEKKKEKEGTEEDKANEEAEKPFDDVKLAEAVEDFMDSMNFKFDEKVPASVAIRIFLIKKIEKKSDIKELKAFISSGKYLDSIDMQHGHEDPKKLQNAVGDLQSKVDTLNAKIAGAQKQLGRTKPPLTDTDKKSYSAELATHNKEKYGYSIEINELNTALERAVAKQSADTKYAHSPEQLLGMINIHFARKAMKTGTPDYMKVMADMHKQLETAYDAQINKGSDFWNRMSPQSWFLPSLASTLKAVMEGDDTLNEITPEKAAELAKAWEKPEAVRSWILSLGRSEEKIKENMTTVVPAIIGHLAASVNADGRASYLNTFSITRGRTLLKNMRQAVHKYSIESAKKSGGEDLDKMGVYFDNLNGINERASEVNHKVVSNHAWWGMAKNVGLTVGAGAGAYGVGAAYAGVTTAAYAASSAAYASLAGLSGLQMAGVGAGVAATGATVGSFAVEDPKTKAFLRRSAVRLAAATGLGALTMASVPFGALPAIATALASAPWLTIGASAGGFFLPDIWKGRNNVVKGTGEAAKGAGKVVKGTAKVAAGTAYVGGRVGWAYTGAVASLLGLGLPLFSKRYRNFFGIHTRPLFKEEFGSSLSSSASKPDTRSVPARKPSNDNAIPFNKQRLDYAA